MVDQRRNNKERKEFDKKSLPIRRVAKVTKGGKRLRFSTVVVVGDHNGRVGVGLGRGADVRSAVEKGERLAEKSVVSIQLIGDTIPHEVVYKYGAAKVMLRPARPGTGVIAGSSVRTVLELAGVLNVYGKILGTPESNSNAYCTFLALKSLRSARVLKKMSKMRARVDLKTELDKDKKAKEEAKKQKKHEEKKDNRRREDNKQVKVNNKK
jgi:small subunit ribosomal protein S5